MPASSKVRRSDSVPLLTTLLASRTEKAPRRLSRGATQRPGRGGGEKPIATSESHSTDDKVAAWLSKTARSSPALITFGGNEGLDEAVNLNRLPMLWLFAYFFSTLVRFCTFVTRSLSSPSPPRAARRTLRVAAGTTTTETTVGDDCEDCGTDVTGDAASSSTSTFSEDGTSMLDWTKAVMLGRMAAARREEDKAAQHLLRAQRRVTSAWQQIVQLQE